MNVQKTGRFIAKLRREAELTQQSLGERIGVSSKTISRWECGSYMPDIEMLEILAREFSVTVDEIIAGERRMSGAAAPSADETDSSLDSRDPDAQDNDDTFTLRERVGYFRKKWLRDHAAAIILCVVAVAALFAAAAARLHSVPIAATISAIAADALYIWQYNRMMSYVESRAFRLGK